ncbi:MAG: PAS domain-containing sensor histidine kinase [Kordiimonadaceae bacterium]|nr:PAS domain-containing sensor histidine kinase [Kordiimonadaceae bacterium]
MRTLKPEDEANTPSPEGKASDMFGGTSLFLDDVENEEAAKKLRRLVNLNDKRTSILLEAMPFGLALHQEQSIVFANKALARLLGYSQNALIGKHCMDFLQRDKESDLFNRFACVFTDGTPINEPALTIVGEDGAESTVQLFVGLIPWEGQPVAQVVIQDVSHVTVMEKILHKQSQEMASALFAETRALQTHKDFVTVITHELRTPLTIIDGSAQMITRAVSAGATDKIEPKTVKILNATARINRLINDILASASMEKSSFKVSPETFDIKALIKDQCSQLASVCETHVIELDLEGLPEEITADKSACTHIINNLLSNAIRYSPNADKINLRGWQENDIVFVAFKDFGGGLPEDELKKIFGQYFRKSKLHAFKGTGIGLNLVKNLLQLQGGDVAVESTLGEGSTFTFHLPLQRGGTREGDIDLDTTDI